MFDEKLFAQISASTAPQKLLIVPAQLTLSAEEAAFRVLGRGRDDFGFFDLQIMSGNKLRQEIASKAGGPGRTTINSLGRSMILRKCARETELDAYAGLSQSQDFLSAAGDFIVQLKQSMCDLSELVPDNDAVVTDPTAAKALPTLKPSGLLARKLSDMAKIYEKYQAFMAGKYMDSEDGLLFAAEQAAKCDWIKQSEIWFCGFYSFTKREQAFLKALDDVSLACHVILESPDETIPVTLQSVYEAAGPSAQALFIASEILRLIREEGYGPEDIAVLSGDIASDGPTLRRCFESMGIPVYTDEKRSLMHLDAPSKIGALLDICADGLRPQSVSIFCKNEALENYIKHYKIKGNAFLKPFKYGGEKKVDAEIARDEFANLIGPFLEDFKNAASVKDKTICLFNFLTDKMQLPQSMHEDAQKLALQGFGDAADELNQTWPVLVQIFEQAVELLGDEELSASEYRDIIKNAFKDIKIGLLPQKSGCIVIGDIYRTKLNNVKALFITSFNDGCIPRNNDAEGILTDAEQKRLAKDGYVLCKPYAQLNKEDKACIYQAFASASEKLYFAYTLADSTGKGMKPSYMLKNLDKDIIKKDAEAIYSLDELIAKLRQCKAEGTLLDDKWQAVAAKYRDSERYGAAVKGLLYKNMNMSLDASAKDKLLKPALASASGLEKYARCPFAYFVQHGLKPAEEKDFEIDKSSIGTIHHEALMRLSRWLSADGLAVSDPRSRWMTVTDDEIRSFISKSIDEIKEEDSSGLLLRGPEEEYRTERVKALAQNFALQMVRQVRLGNIDSILSEEGFSLTFAGTKLIGKIDRIDITRLGDKELIKIVDYKSGKTSFSKDLIEKGLAIQLMLYLEAATDQAIGDRSHWLDSDQWGRTSFGDESSGTGSLTQMSEGMSEGTGVCCTPVHEGTGVCCTSTDEDGSGADFESSGTGPLTQMSEGTGVCFTPGLNEGTGVCFTPGMNEGTGVRCTPDLAAAGSGASTPGSGADLIGSGITSGKAPIGTFYFHIENPRDAVSIEHLSDAALEKFFKLDGAYISDNLIYIDKTATGENASRIVKDKQQMSADEFEALRRSFRDKLSETIARLNSGDISVRPRTISNTETSCRYCPYNGLCNFDKDTEGFTFS